MAATRLRIAREKRASELIFNTSTWTGSDLYLDGNAWSTTSNDILSNVETAKGKVRAATGMEADTLICNAKNLGYLLTNDDIVGRVQYARVAGESAVKQALADILGLKKIIVSRRHYNSAKEGQSHSGSPLWSDSYAMVCKTADTESLVEPCVGRTFLFAADSAMPVTMESYYDDDTRCNVYRARHYMDELVMDSGFGFLLKVD